MSALRVHSAAVILFQVLVASVACSSSEQGNVAGTGGTTPTGGASGAASGGTVATSGGVPTTSPGGTSSGGAPAAGGSSAGSAAGGNASGGASGGAAGANGGSTSGGASAGLGGTTAGSGGKSTASGGSAGTTVGSGGKSAGSGGAGGSNAGAGGKAGSGGAGGAATSNCADGASNTYFVDSAAGDDARAGTSLALAWRTLGPVNARTFQPGDRLCLKSGGTWTGQLAPKGSGSAAAPIIIDQYGSAAKPRIAAGAGDLQALLLSNQQYWEINNLELTNDKASPGDFRGISVRGKNGGTLSHIVIRNSYIHDVSGVVNWIGGDTADNQAPWITFQTGWDASKRTGGIVFEVETSTMPTQFDGVVIENNVIEDVSFGGIIFKQFEGTVGWGVRNSRTDTRFRPHKNIVVRGNFISQTGTQYGCNGVYLTGVQGVVIERNVVKDAGTSAIEVYNADDVLIQENETFGTVRKAGGADFNGIDADRATTKTIIQYNYVHNNGDGILLCQFEFGDVIVRYNVVTQSSRYSVNLHSDSAATSEIYNNLFFAEGLNSASLISTSGNGEHLAARYAIRNNILHTSRSADVARTGSGVTYANNLYSGLPAAVGDASARTGSPMFVDSTMRPNGGASGPALALEGFKLRSGSPAVNNGVTISSNGGRDFWKGTLYVGTPDIGPYEAP